MPRRAHEELSFLSAQGKRSHQSSECSSVWYRHTALDVLHTPSAHASACRQFALRQARMSAVNPEQLADRLTRVRCDAHFAHRLLRFERAVIKI
jgi:hypothetical protein